MTFERVEKIHMELLLEFASSLPASPRIFARLSKLIENEDTALDYISSLVKMDPGLSAQILRVTNSAYYGASFKINDVETAISRIGFREVQKILSMVVTHECFFQALPVYDLEATEFAEQCVDVAVSSETLAKRVGIDMNAPYIAGLLHQIGKLAINLYLERMDQLVDLTAYRPDQPVELAEQELLGVTHWRVSYSLLQHWQFEPAIWQPIRNQPLAESAAGYLKESALLRLALWISSQIEHYDFEAALPADLQWALTQLSIDPLDIPRLIDEARFEINDRKNLLSMLL